MIENDHFAASFDLRAGTLSLRRADGAAFLTAAAACANTGAGKHSTASPGREHSVDTAPYRDRLGAGQRLSIVSRDPEKALDLRTEVVLYERAALATIEVHCTNVSPRDVEIASLEPVRAAGDGSALHVPGVTACLTNGPMYFDAGRLHAFADEPPPGCRPPVKGARLVARAERRWLASREHPAAA